MHLVVSIHIDKGREEVRIEPVKVTESALFIRVSVQYFKINREKFERNIFTA